jgi:Leucine-rich repeat (LRR) protein
LETLPVSFGYIKILANGRDCSVVLDLSNNQLVSMPLSLTNLTIKTKGGFSSKILLNLSNNQLTDWPESFENLNLSASYVKIDLSDNLLIISNEEREALIDLYNNTNGSNWTNNNGWMGEIGTECQWFGVQCNENGTYIIKVDLNNNNLVGFIPESINIFSDIDLSDNELKVKINEKERIALVDLYHNTNGVNWLNKDNWLGEVGTECSWYGITCSTEGRDVIKIDLNNNNLNGIIPESFAFLKNVFYYDFSDNKLTSISNCYTIINTNSYDNILLDFSNNLLTSLPDNFFKLKFSSSGSITLDFSNNQLSTLPDSFMLFNMSTKGFYSDIILNISNNQLESLPESFADMNISTADNYADILIDISNNQLTAMPESITKLNLSINTDDANITLNLSNNKLKYRLDNLELVKGYSIIYAGNPMIPPQEEREFLIDLYNNTNGEDWINNNDWLGGPETTCNWFGITCNEFGSNIIDIQLQGNNLVGIVPETIKNLKYIQVLDLSKNKLYSLPDSFGNLSLSAAENVLLNFSDNQLTTLPESLKNLKILTYDYDYDSIYYINVHIDFSNNQLIQLPDSIGNLSIFSSNIDLSLINNLNIDLSYNRLTTVPESFGKIGWLGHLDLSNNQLSTLPDFFENLKHIQVLDLSNNQLSILPDSFGNISFSYSLYKNVILDCSNNNLSTLPESIKNLKLTKKKDIHEIYVRFDFSNNQLTKLPDSISSLSIFSSINYSIHSRYFIIDLSYNQLTTLPKDFGNISYLNNLDLSNNQLTTLPDSFGNSSYLDNLYLSNNQLTTLPDSFGNSSYLDNLYLSNNQLTSLPDSFGNLSYLTNLDLSNNQLTSLPDSFGNITYSNGKIDLSNNKLNTLPDCFGNLGSIDFLDLSNNQLTTLPDSFGNLRYLTNLDLSNNQLSTLPTSFRDLNSLNYLNLSNNKHLKIPIEINLLQNFSELILFDNQSIVLREALVDLYYNCNGDNWLNKEGWLGDVGTECSWYGVFCDSLNSLRGLKLNNNNLKGNIPESFSNIIFIDPTYNQAILDLSNNHLTGLPESFGKMIFLHGHYIDLSNNQFSSLPDSFGELIVTATALNLSHNYLTTLPENFGNLKISKIHYDYRYKVYLYLSNNKLTKLPDSFGNLSSLQTLELNKNQLTSLPDSFGNLSSLQTLELNKNQLTSFPDSFGNLSLLQTLELNNNRLISLPDSFGNLSLLQTLELNNNRLISLPDSFGYLPLSILNLNNNALLNLPVSFDRLTSLDSLEIKNNILKNLPDSFGNLENIKNLNISKNKLTRLPDSCKNLHNITNLNLSSNLLTQIPDLDYGIIQLLDISNNQIYTDCVVDSSTLEELDLSYNYIESLRITTKSLRSLDISHNKLNQLTIQEKLSQLTSLNLEYNDLNELPNIIYESINLIDLDISNNTFTELKNEITNLFKLKQLDISSNQLDSIPYFINKLKLLDAIDLSKNNITDCSSDISSFQFINVLNLSGNDIKELPSDIEKLTQLVELNLSNCKLNSLPHELGNLTGLKILDLSYNTLNEKDLPSSLENLTNLNNLSLSSNQLNDLPNQVLNLKDLIILDLSDNELKQELPAEISQLSNLLYINLDGTQLYTTNPALYEFISQRSSGWLNSTPPLPTQSDDNTIRYITSSANQLSYSIDKDIPVSIVFHSPASLDNGNLIVTLETGDNDQEITIPPFSNSITATGIYTVKAGDFSNKLNVLSVSLTNNASLTNEDNRTIDLTLPESFNLSDMRNIYVDAAKPEIDVIYPRQGYCLQQIERLEGTGYDQSGNFVIELQLFDGENYYYPENNSWFTQKNWFNPSGSQLPGVNRKWIVDTSDVQWSTSKTYTIYLKANDLAGNLSYTHVQFTYGKEKSNITCEVPGNIIVLGDSLTITGTIHPPDSIINAGVSIELISPLNEIYYKSVKAQKDGSFYFDIQCNDINTSGLWHVVTTWEGHDCLLPAISEPISLTVKKATTEIVLDVTHDAIKYGESISISGIFAPVPDCGGDLSGVQILLDFTNGIETLSETIYTNDRAGHFQIVNYMGLNALGDWQIQAFVFDENNAYETSTSAPMIVRVVESAGYAILVQGMIENEEGLSSHKKTCNFVYEQLRQRGVKDDMDFDDIRFFYNYNPDTEPEEKEDIYETPHKIEIEKAFTIWAADKMNQKPANLYVVLLDHGLEDNFFIYPDSISSTEIGLWLDQLQSKLIKDAMEQEIVVILGFCHSGSFIDELSGTRRVIIASAAANEFSYKGPLDKDNIREGEFFVSEFFKSVSLGKSVNESFVYAVQLTERFTESISLGSVNAPPFFDNSAQHPLLDDNGDGVGTNDLTISGNEGKLSQNLIIGVSSLTGNDPGDVDIIKVADTLYIDGSTTFPNEVPYAILDSEAFVSLWIEIKPPDYINKNDSTTEQKELDLPKLIWSTSQAIEAAQMNKISCLNLYQGNIPHLWTWEYILSNTNIDFSQPGAYKIFYFAKDKDSGNVSPFKETRVYKNKEFNNPPDPFEILTPVNGSIISIQGVLLGCDFKSTPDCYTHLSWEYAIDPDEDIITYTVLLSQDNDNFSDPCTILKQELINENTCSIDLPDDWDGSIVYWKVLAIDQFGAIRESSINHFTINNYGNPEKVQIQARIINSNTNEVIPDALFKVSGNIKRTTGRRGFYFFGLEPGSYNIHISKPGFLSIVKSDINFIAGKKTLIYKLELDPDYENDPPIIKDMSDITATESQAFDISINITDDKTAPELLIITPISSNTTLIPDKNMSITGLSPNYKLHIIPANNLTGSVEIMIKAYDGYLESSKTFAVDILPYNDPPEIYPIDDTEIKEDQSLESLPFEIHDIDSELESIVITFNSSNQSLVKNSNIRLSGSGSLRFLSLTPEQNNFGTTVITILASDGTNEIHQSFKLKVVPVNDAPIAYNMTITALENTLKGITLTAMDYDGDPLSYLFESQPIHGSITGQPPFIYYTPKKDFCGDDTFSYYVNDNFENSDVKKINLSVLPKDCQPVISDITVQTDENNSIDIQLSGNDISGNNNALYYKVVSPPNYGTYVLNSSFIQYRPDLYWSGMDRLEYISKCSGCSEKESEKAQINITVLNTIDEAPIIYSINNYITNENLPIVGIPVIITDSDSPVNEIQIFVSSSNKTLIPDDNIAIHTISNSHYLSITPANNINGQSIITVRCVSEGKSATEEFLLTVKPVDCEPYVLTPINNFSVNEDSPYTIIDISDVFYDKDNDNIIKSIQSNSADYLVKAFINGNTLRLDFAENHSGEATIVLLGSSNNQLIETSFSITVNEINDIPVVSDFSITGNQSTASYLPLISFYNAYNDIEEDQLNTIRITALPDNGSLFFNTIYVNENYEMPVSDFTGTSLKYQPPDGWNGSTCFSWQAFDGTSWSNTANVNILIVSNPVNIASIFKQSYEDMDVDFDKSDLEGFSLDNVNSQIMLVTEPENGNLLFDFFKTTHDHPFDGFSVPAGYTWTVQELISGELIFRPLENYYGTLKFLWRASKDGIWSDNEYVFLQILPINDIPIIENSILTGDEDISLKISYQFLYTLFKDVDNDILTSIRITRLPENGTLIKGNTVINENDEINYNEMNNLAYVPNKNFFGFDTLTWNGFDGTAYANSSGMLSITIHPVDDIPEIVNPIPDIVLNEDSKEYIIDLSDKFIDVDNDNKAITKKVLFNSNLNLLSTDISENLLSLKLNKNQHGKSNILLKIESNDLFINHSFSVTVNPVDDPPMINKPLDDISIDEDSMTNIDLSQLFFDIDNQGIIVKSVESNNNNLINANITGDLLVLKCIDNQHGETTITINGISDDKRVFDIFNVNVIPVDDPPVVSNIPNQFTDEDTSINIGLNIDDIDTSLENLTIHASSSDQNLVPNDNIIVNKIDQRYELEILPENNSHGDTFIIIQIADDNTSIEKRFQLTVMSINDAPVAESFRLETIEQTKVFIALKGFDPENAPITYEITDDPKKGYLKGNAPHFIYYPDQGACGMDHFTYQISDGTEQSLPADITINMTPISCEPNAIDNNYSMEMNTIKEIKLTGYEISNTNLSYSIVDYPMHGDLIVSVPYVQYIPQKDWFGEDSFTFSASCGFCSPLISKPASINISVSNENNNAPVILGIYNMSIDEDTSKSISFYVKDNDTSYDNISITATVTPPELVPVHSQQLICKELSCQLDISLAKNKYGQANITITANDGNSKSFKSIVLDVMPVNDPPIMNTINGQQTNEDNTIQNIILNIQDVDTFIQNLEISFKSSNTNLMPVSGICLKQLNQLYYMSLKPDKNEFGESQITVIVKDADLITEQKFNITVLPVNDAPVAKDLKIETVEDIEAAITLQGSDVENEPLSFSIVDLPKNGSLIGNAPDLIYVPYMHFCGDDQFSYQVSDGEKTSDIKTVIIKISPIICEPEAFDMNVYTQMNVSKSIILSGYELSQKPISYSIVSNPSYGSIEGIPPNITYIPDNNWSGEDQFTYITTCSKCTPKTSQAAFVKISVSDPNNTPPVIHVKSEFKINEDTPAEIVFFVTDSDTSFNDLDITATIEPPELIPSYQQKLSCYESTCSLQIVPEKNSFGNAVVDIYASDGITNVSKSIMLEIKEVNDAPEIEITDKLEINEDSALTNIPIRIKDIESENDASISVISSNPDLVDSSNIEITGAGTQRNLAISPELNQWGSAIITFFVDDGKDSTKKEILLNVNPVNDAPVAYDMNIKVNDQYVIDIILKASDVDFDQLNYKVLSDPSNGTLIGVAPYLFYKPYVEKQISDQFTYIVSDRFLESNIATVSIEIDHTTPGDYDNNNIVDLEDIIVILKALSGIRTGNISLDSNIIEKKTIGIDDAIHLIKYIINEKNTQ